MAKTAQDRLNPRLDFAGPDLLVEGMRQLGWSRFDVATQGSLPPHHHPDCYEICYIAHGHVSWQAGGQVYDLRSGDLYLTWPDEIHAGTDNTIQPSEIYWAIFHVPHRGSLARLPRGETRRIRQALSRLPSRSAPAAPSVSRHFETLIHCHRDRPPHAALAARAAFHLLLHHVLQDLSTPAHRLQPSSERIQRSIQFMENNLGEAKLLQEAARVAKLKPTQFRALFRRETGSSPSEFLAHQRTQAAKRLLRDASLSITDIAFRLGYSSSQHFATQFRRRTSLTPTAYRRQG